MTFAIKIAVRVSRNIYLGSVLIKNLLPFAFVLWSHFLFTFLIFPPTFLDHEDMRALLNVVICDPQHLLELLQALIHPMYMEVHDEL